MEIKHCILVKWINKEIQNKEFLDRIQDLFNKTLEIEGIKKVDLLTNVIDRPNRYDLLIEITMEETSLPIYDNSLSHKEWKSEYSSLIEKKAIFDFKA